MKQSLSLPLIFIAGLLFTVIYGCTGGSNNDSTAITLTVTDCSSDKVTITHDTKASNSSPNRWILSSTITVKCDGKVVEGAELEVKLWFTTAFKRKTDAAGQIKIRENKHTSPKGQKIKVTIRGNDGDDDYKTEEFTVP